MTPPGDDDLDDVVPDDPAGPRRRPGGRSARVRETVLAAVLEQIADSGVNGVRVADVAARAGVAETTVYRRWPTPTALIADAITDLAARENPSPDTGSLRGDLIRLTEQIAQLLDGPGIARLLGAALALANDAEVAVARQRFWDLRFDSNAHLVERAKARGELPAEVEPRELLETVAAPIYFRVLVGGAPFDAAFINRCVDDALTIHQR
ncbi:TetR/AcrR family transcriptional regulator [Gordonia sinesedis]